MNIYDHARTALCQHVSTGEILRIFIAEKHFETSLTIERMLNFLGYYRIAPIKSFEELLTLTDSAFESVDLLIVNTTLASSYNFDLAELSRIRPHILHVLCYETPRRRLSFVVEHSSWIISENMKNAPDIGSLSIIMKLIETSPPKKLPPRSPALTI